MTKKHLRSVPDHGLIDEAPNRQPSHEPEPQPHIPPEVVDFARWFADWWLRRGVQHLGQEEEDERAAA